MCPVTSDLRNCIHGFTYLVKALWPKGRGNGSVVVVPTALVVVRGRAPRELVPTL